MDANQTTVLLIVGVLAIIFLIALFYILRIEGKKQKTTTSQETTPPAATIEAPKKAEVVQVVEPKPQAATVETPKKAEAVQVVEPKPQAATIETPQKAEVIQVAPVLKSQTATVETPEKAQPAHMEEAKVKKTERQKVSAGKKPAPKRKDRGSKIIEIEGIGPTNAEKLNSINILTTSDLLESGATPRGRKELADKTGIPPKLILEWVNLADLFRIKGIGEEYSDLLEEAGVDTVVELSRRNAANLHAKILEVNEGKKLVRRPPSLTSIENWIQEAKDLPRIVEY